MTDARPQSKLTLGRSPPPSWYVLTPPTSVATQLIPGYGSAGQAIKVEANMFQTRLAPEAAGTIQ